MSFRFPRRLLVSYLHRSVEQCTLKASETSAHKRSCFCVFSLLFLFFTFHAVCFEYNPRLEGGSVSLWQLNTASFCISRLGIYQFSFYAVTASFTKGGTACLWCIFSTCFFLFCFFVSFLLHFILF